MTNICMFLRFIWIMGTAMAYSFTGLLRRVTPKYQIFLKIFKRACILFVLGLLINTEGCEGKDILYVHKHIKKKKENWTHCRPKLNWVLQIEIRPLSHCSHEIKIIKTWWIRRKPGLSLYNAVKINSFKICIENLHVFIGYLL